MQTKPLLHIRFLVQLGLCASRGCSRLAQMIKALMPIGLDCPRGCMGTCARGTEEQIFSTVPFRFEADLALIPFAANIFSASNS
ncbi:hypothetical protein BKA83DRAFT_4338966 [Pisolithus microcarpus]|nr:hypothetical protein BKA83DRAFT_4338966 [Pisolithus microcarpus]